MTDLDERQKKAFDFVSDYTKQLITLATGVITLMVTFLGDELKNGSVWSKGLLIFSWGFFAVSICFGIVRLMNLTGNLDPVDSSKSPNLTITSDNVRNSGKIQILSFLFAIVFSIIFGILQLFSDHKKESKDKTIIILQQPAPCAGKTLSVDTLYPLKPKYQLLKGRKPKKNS